MIGVYVKRENIVIELCGSFKRSQFNVRATVPFNATFGVFSIVGQTKSNTHLQSEITRCTYILQMKIINKKMQTQVIYPFCD